MIFGISCKWYGFGLKGQRPRLARFRVRVRVNTNVCTITQKGIIPTFSNLVPVIGNDLMVSYKCHGFWLKGQRSMLGLGL